MVFNNNGYISKLIQILLLVCLQLVVIFELFFRFLVLQVQRVLPAESIQVDVGILQGYLNHRLLELVKLVPFQPVGFLTFLRENQEIW